MYIGTVGLFIIIGLLYWASHIVHKKGYEEGYSAGYAHCEKGIKYDNQLYL